MTAWVNTPGRSHRRRTHPDAARRNSSPKLTKLDRFRSAGLSADGEPPDDSTARAARALRSTVRPARDAQSGDLRVRTADRHRRHGLAAFIYRGQRVASHVRSPLKGRHTTADEHIPEKHRKMGQWSPERFIRWATTMGPDTAALITTVLGSRRHPQQAFRSCLGILRLAETSCGTSIRWG